MDERVGKGDEGRFLWLEKRAPAKEPFYLEEKQSCAAHKPYIIHLASWTH